MAPNPGESVGVLPPSSLRNARCGRGRTVDCCGDGEEVLVRFGRFVLAPVLADVVDRFSSCARLQDPGPESGDQQARSVGSFGIDEMVRQGEIDAIDPVRRAVEDSRHKTGDVVYERAAPHFAQADADCRAAPVKSTPFSCKAVIKGAISPQSAFSR